MSIEEFVNTAKEAREDLASSEYLNFVFGMAKWRRTTGGNQIYPSGSERYGIFQTPNSSLKSNR